MFDYKININSLKKLNILVIGDAMIDAYYYGSIKRQNPEANVPIVDVESIENRLGGAANVALNINSLSAQAHLMYFDGNDEKASLLKYLLKQENINTLPISSERKTSIKTRVYNNNSYALRIDDEENTAMNNSELTEVKEKLVPYLQENNIDAVILQDYNKGFFSPESIAFICTILKENNIPFAVDPKINNFFTFKHATLFKPNLKEINVALKKTICGENHEEIKAACAHLLEKTASENIMLTLAEHGAVALNHDKFYSEKAHKRNVIDVSGAGDTVIAMASLLLALKAPIGAILYYSNLAGGLVIEERGVQALSIEKLIANIS